MADGVWQEGKGQELRERSWSNAEDQTGKLKEITGGKQTIRPQLIEGVGTASSISRTRNTLEGFLRRAQEKQRVGTRKRGMVPKAGLEPARVSPHAPQTCASAISPLRPGRIIPRRFINLHLSPPTPSTSRGQADRSAVRRRSRSRVWNIPPERVCQDSERVRRRSDQTAEATEGRKAETD